MLATAKYDPILVYTLCAISDTVFSGCSSTASIIIKIMISNGNRTEWSPIRSVIIRVITKSDDRAAGVRFVYHEYDYRPNWTTRSSVTN